MDRLTDAIANFFSPQLQNVSLRQIVQIVQDYDEVVESMGNAPSDRMDFYQHALKLLNQEMIEISNNNMRSRGDDQNITNNPTSKNH